MTKGIRSYFHLCTSGRVFLEENIPKATNGFQGKSLQGGHSQGTKCLDIGDQIYSLLVDSSLDPTA